MNNSDFNIKKFTIAAFIISCFFLCACENDIKKVDAWTKKVVLKEEAVNVNSQLSQGGKIRATLKAPLMWRIYSDTVYVEFPKTLHCDFYNDSTKTIETFLDCRYGKYFETYNKVFLKDSVVVINIKGDTLRTPELWWDQNTKMFYTDKPSEYISKDKKLYPQYGIEATQDFTRVTFKQPTGIIKLKEGTFPQ
jgi:Lipopolysaccharide-assembly, LptC-related